MMVAGIAAGRGVSAATVEKNFGRGRTLMASEAVRVGMADRVQTFGEVLSQARAGLFDKLHQKRGTVTAPSSKVSTGNESLSRFSINPEPPPQHVLRNRLEQYLR